MLIIRYGEIALKGKNRRKFEEKLKNDILSVLKKNGFYARAKLLWGRLLIYTSNEAADIVSKIPGVVSVSIAEELEYDDVKNYLLNELKKFDPKDFRISTHRVDKKFPKTSMEIDKELGAFVVKNFNWKVNLKAPELNIGIEIIEGKAYVFFEKIKGIGGLPSGSQGRLVALISSGIDSPVATFLMLKRGVDVTAVHFYQTLEEKENVEEIIQTLNKYSVRDIELVSIEHEKSMNPLISGLKEIRRTEWTCIFCKVNMLKTAQKIAKEREALGIITGDSLGQVASQTLKNLYIESSAVELPIYRPLVGLDKEEITIISKRIGTFDTFMKMPNTSCIFRPSSVVTQGKFEEFQKIMKSLMEKGIF